MLLTVIVAVGAVGTPENAGLSFSPCTNAVVASVVLLSPYAIVGAVGVPVSTILARRFCTNSVVAN